MTLEEKAKEILLYFEDILDKPASISGKYHTGESFRDHIETCASIMRHLCDEFKINEEDRDMLIACAYLHDIGSYLITVPMRVKKMGWKYFKHSKCSRSRSLHLLHPYISAMLLDEFEIPEHKRRQMQNIISSHMGHWYPKMKQPKSFYQKLLCIADYLSTRQNLLTYNGEQRQ